MLNSLLRKFQRSNKAPKLELTGLEIKKQQESRRRFMKKLFFLGATTVVTGIEMRQPAESEAERNKHPSPKLGAVLDILKEEFPDIVITYEGNEEVQHPAYPSMIPQRRKSISAAPKVEKKRVQPDNVMQVAERVYHYVADPKASSTNDGGGLESPISYAATYRRSKEDSKSTPQEDLDCNDHANWACELLDEHHVPVYTISTWANSPDKGFKHWHIFTVCKVHDSKFLIIDNSAKATVWEGCLSDFIAQYGGVEEGEDPNVRVVPYGMSRYVKPKHNCPVSKMLVQLSHTINDESEMKSIGEEPAFLGPIACKQEATQSIAQASQELSMKISSWMKNLQVAAGQ